MEIIYGKAMMTKQIKYITLISSILLLIGCLPPQRSVGFNTPVTVKSTSHKYNNARQHDSRYKNNYNRKKDYGYKKDRDYNRRDNSHNRRDNSYNRRDNSYNRRYDI